MFKPATIQEARQDYRAASCTWSPWNHSEWLGMTLIVFLLPLWLYIQDFKSSSVQARELWKFWATPVGWRLNKPCLDSACVSTKRPRYHRVNSWFLLQLQVYYPICGVLVFLVRLLRYFHFIWPLGEVLQWRSKKRWTKSTVFPWGMRTPSQNSWPSLCLCHPHWSTRNCLMSKNLTRPHELLLKCK